MTRVLEIILWFLSHIGLAWSGFVLGKRRALNKGGE